MLKKAVILCSVIINVSLEYCQSCQSSPCGFYGKNVESCRTGTLLGDHLLEAFNWRKCEDGRCPSNLPCSNWIDGIEASGGRRWPPLPKITKAECLKKCSETYGCVGAVLIANKMNNYKDPAVTGNCHRSSNFSVGRAWARNPDLQDS